MSIANIKAWLRLSSLDFIAPGIFRYRDSGLIRLLGACLLIGSIAPHPVQASTLTITATYKGSVTKTGGQFTNTTPPSGICAYFPYVCPADYFSILFPWAGNASGAMGRKELRIGGSRTSMYLKFDSTPRLVTVVNSSGASGTIDLSIDSIGFSNNPEASGGYLPYYGTPGGRNCRSVIAPFKRGTSTAYVIWGSVERGGAECFLAAASSPIYNYTEVGQVSFRYTLTLQKPWQWQPGIYRGSDTYTIGKGRDLDFGDNFQGSADDVVINFVLTVQPDMYVNFPTAQGGVVDALMVPPGGWINPDWQGVVPPYIAAEVPFDFGVSGAVKIGLQCQHPIGDTCGIVDDAGGGEPLAIDALLTDRQLKDDGGMPAVDSRLSTTNRVFTSGTPGGSGVTSARLKFKTQPDVTRQLVAGHRYGGLATIVFDSDL